MNQKSPKKQKLEKEVAGRHLDDLLWEDSPMHIWPIIAKAHRIEVLHGIKEQETGTSRQLTGA